MQGPLGQVAGTSSVVEWGIKQIYPFLSLKWASPGNMLRKSLHAGGTRIFPKAVQGCMLKAARVVGRDLGSQCPIPHLPLSGLPSFIQNESKFLVAPSNISKPSSAFRGSGQRRERGARA